MTTRIPVDSADAAELREAAAERETSYATDDGPLEHDPRCRRGWLGEDDEGRPRPCLACRPWLADPRCVVCGQTYVACSSANGCCDQCDHPRSER